MKVKDPSKDLGITPRTSLIGKVKTNNLHIFAGPHSFFSINSLSLVASINTKKINSYLFLYIPEKVE